MSSDAWGTGAGGPPPEQPGYPPPYGYPGPAGHPPPGYGSPPGYPPPPTPGSYYPGQYPPPFGFRPTLKPGVIPLRPLSMSELFNASVNYVRTNPKAALGLTTVVVVVAQLISFLLQIGPLTTSGALREATGQAQLPDYTAFDLMAPDGAPLLTTTLADVVLSGLLTVVVGRAVFGGTIGIGDAWRRIRGRLLALLAYTAIEAVVIAVLVAVTIGVIYAVDSIVGDAAAIVVGGLSILAVTALLVYLYTMLSFTPTLIVLERLSVRRSITRSLALVRTGFWRVLGIRLLGSVAVGLVAVAVSAPFAIVGQLLVAFGETTLTTVVAAIVISVGGAIGQIITAPFNAGVVVLLYADRRMRAEAFDLVLQTGAAGPVESTDDLWLTPQR